jgi:hypothetical protein
VLPATLAEIPWSRLFTPHDVSGARRPVNRNFGTDRRECLGLMTANTRAAPERPAGLPVKVFKYSHNAVQALDLRLVFVQKYKLLRQVNK